MGDRFLEKNNHRIVFHLMFDKKQFRLHLIELNGDAARKVLQEAQHFAEEKGLKAQAMMISHVHDKILNQLDQWHDMVHRNSSIMQRLELAVSSQAHSIPSTEATITNHQGGGNGSGKH